ncbi:MAG: hypothetical protein AAGK02_02595 [Pseudomonadota bacterium]
MGKMAMPADQEPDNGARKSLWDSLGEILQSPMDWAFAMGGAAIGVTLGLIFQLPDTSTSLGAGALIAVALRKATNAVLAGKRVERRATGLLNLLREKPNEEVSIIINQLEREIKLYRHESISKEELSKSLDIIVDKYRACEVFSQTIGFEGKKGLLEDRRTDPEQPGS